MLVHIYLEISEISEIYIYNLNFSFSFSFLFFSLFLAVLLATT